MAVWVQFQNFVFHCKKKKTKKNEWPFRYTHLADIEKKIAVKIKTLALAEKEKERILSKKTNYYNNKHLLKYVWVKLTISKTKARK